MKQIKSIKTTHEEGSMIEVIIAVLVGLLILLAVALMLWSIYKTLMKWIPAIKVIQIKNKFIYYIYQNKNQVFGMLNETREEK